MVKLDIYPQIIYDPSVEKAYETPPIISRDDDEAFEWWSNLVNNRVKFPALYRVLRNDLKEIKTTEEDDTEL